VGKLLGGVAMPLIAALGFWQLRIHVQNVVSAEYVLCEVVQVQFVLPECMCLI
jgi:hypothetical protein